MTIFAIIKARNNFIFQDIVKRLALDGVLVALIFIFFAVPDAPAAIFGVPLVPPAIEDTEIL